MIRRRQQQMSFTQLVLFGALSCPPEELMDPELRRIDTLLDDDAVLDPVVDALGKRWPNSRCRGRYGTPADTVLRMIALRYLRQWSWQRLVWEVTGNVVYRRFCRIDGGKVPDDKTLIKIHKLIDPDVLEQVHRRTVEVAIERKVTRGRKMRVDTTVVAAPMRYPVDSRLCEDVVRVLGRGVRKLRDAGVALGFQFRNVKRSISRRMREIGEVMRLRGRDARREAIKKPYRRLLKTTRLVVRWARRAIDTAREQLEGLAAEARRCAELTVDRLETMLPLAKRVADQTRARIVKGQTRSEGKLVSIFEPYAQILRRGKKHRPTEFGVMVKVQEAEGGIIADIRVVKDKNDAPLLVPSVNKHKEIFGRAPHLAATDRGFYSMQGEREIAELGVKRAVIPKRGPKSRKRAAMENERWFVRGRAWRAGGEARISYLKNSFGMGRNRNRGERGMGQAVAWAGICNNLMTIARRTA